MTVLDVRNRSPLYFRAVVYLDDVRQRGNVIYADSETGFMRRHPLDLLRKDGEERPVEEIWGRVVIHDPTPDVPTGQ